MNDKCAAGTGRFYETMAGAFEMSLPEFSKLSLTAKNVIPITAQCTVFAESEVITLVVKLKVVDLGTDPQLMGALGAAEYARQKGLAKRKGR